jgi:hypothetical protein
LSTSHNAWQASCTCTVAARSLRAPSRLDPHRVAPQRSAAERLAAREVGAAQVRARSLAAAAEGLEVDAAEARALNECVQRGFEDSPHDVDGLPRAAAWPSPVRRRSSHTPRAVV